jgi:hypothetical protein
VVPSAAASLMRAAIVGLAGRSSRYAR